MLIRTLLANILSVSILLSGCTTTGMKYTDKSPKGSTSLSTLYQYRIIDSNSRKSLSVEKLASKLKTTDVIFMGEFHSHQGAHKLQLDLLETMFYNNPRIILSMEQFTRDAQPILDGYLAGKYGENTLIEEGDAWEHYKGSYRSIVEFAREHKIPVIAANAPAMFVRCVGKKGVDVLKTIDDEKKAWSAQKLDLANEQYKAKFMSYLKHAGTSHGQTNEVANKMMMNTYAAQLLRDTTMAESIDAAIKTYPDHQVIHLNGAFHSDGHLGTVAVFETMNPDLSVSVMSPVMVKDPENPEATSHQFSQGDFLYLLKAMPARYIDKKKEKESITRLIRERMKKKCEL